MKQKAGGERGMRDLKHFFLISRKNGGMVLVGRFRFFDLFRVKCLAHGLPLPEKPRGRIFDPGAWAAKVLPDLNQKKAKALFELVENGLGCNIDVAAAMAAARA